MCDRVGFYCSPCLQSTTTMNENNENEGDEKDDKVVSTNVKGKKPKKRSTVPVRKRYEHVKRHVNKPKVSVLTSVAHVLCCLSFFKWY